MTHAGPALAGKQGTIKGLSAASLQRQAVPAALVHIGRVMAAHEPHEGLVGGEQGSVHERGAAEGGRNAAEQRRAALFAYRARRAVKPPCTGQVFMYICYGKKRQVCMSDGLSV